MRESGRTKSLKDACRKPTSKNCKASSSKQANHVEGKRSPSSSTTPTTSSGGANPLENSLILDHLFKLCPVKMLATCRLVSKQWYQESLLLWRNAFPVITFTLGEDEDHENRLFLLTPRVVIDGRVVEGHELQLRTGLDYFLRCFFNQPQSEYSKIPYRFIRIQDSKFSLNLEQFQDLWGAMGANLTTLHLSKCTFQEVEEFRHIIFATCPNLRTLILEGCEFPPPGLEQPSTELVEYREPAYGKHQHLNSFQISEISNPFPISWLELLSHFQSLAHFSMDFGGLYSPYKDEFDRVTDAIRTVRSRDPKALPFKSVQIGNELDISRTDDPDFQKRVEIVQELRLPIKSLIIRAVPGMDEDLVKTNLEFHAKTVGLLHLIGFDLPGQPFPFGLPLDNLTTLDIRGEVGLGKFCDSLVFLKFTPNLKLLALSDMGRIVSNSCRKEMGNLRMVHLVELRLVPRTSFILTDQDLANLFEWMPHLRALQGPLDDIQFQFVCGSWKKLKSLTVHEQLLSDVGVTGMEPLPPNLKGKKKKKFLKKATHPNITDLEYLEEFGFWSQGVTDQSVFHGFLQLAHLRKIKFCSRNLRWSLAARDALREKKIELRLRDNGFQYRELQVAGDISNFM